MVCNNILKEGSTSHCFEALNQRIGYFTERNEAAITQGTLGYTSLAQRIAEEKSISASATKKITKSSIQFLNYLKSYTCLQDESDIILSKRLRANADRFCPKSMRTKVTYIGRRFCKEDG
ncbi:hypothetical protein Tco_0204368 [Tanacetum coccineum]